MGLSEACQPAIKYAFDGIPVHPRVALDWSLDGKNLSGIARDLYLINGDVPKVGQVFAAPGQGEILKKISEWPKCIETAENKLEPHRVPVYLYDLSSLFHSYWNMGKDDETKRFISNKKNISDDKLIFLKAISNIIKSGMNILGVETPEKM